MFIFAKKLLLHNFLYEDSKKLIILSCRERGCVKILIRHSDHDVYRGKNQEFALRLDPHFQVFAKSKELSCIVIPSKEGIRYSYVCMDSRLRDSVKTSICHSERSEESSLRATFRFFVSLRMTFLPSFHTYSCMGMT
jgi:hypothetical protein